MSESTEVDESDVPFDLSVFHQTDWWRDRTGETHEVAELSPQECAQLADWLEEHALHFFTQVVTREMLRSAQRAEDERYGEPVVEVDDLPVMRVTASWWMAQTDLVRALRG